MTRADSANRTPWIVRVGAVVALVTSIVLAGCGDDGGDDGLAGASTDDAGAGDGGDGARTGAGGSGEVVTFEVGPAVHVDGAVDYPQTPPVGGDHAAVWTNCGAYDDPVVTEMGVHAMEHGAVWITYRDDLADAVIEELHAFADESYVLVSPWPDDDLPAPIVASAWGAQLRLDEPDGPVLESFLDTYRAAASAPEPGAPCTGGADGDGDR